MSNFLKSISQIIAGREHDLYRVAEIRGDAEPEVMELMPGAPLQNVYSVAKAFTVAGVGLLFDRGLLSTDEAVPDALGSLCPESYHPLWKETTVHMLLKHMVGLPKNCLDIDAQDANAFGEDYLRYTMNLPLAADHGTVHRYTDAAYYMLSCIVENRAGMALDDFLARELFALLGFGEIAWSHCPKGHAMGATGLFIRAEDMVKLGALYMNGGVWRGRRILSAEWVKLAIERQYEFGRLQDGAAYGKGGMFGQNLLVVPGQSRCVAWQAAGGIGNEGLTQFTIDYRD